VIAVAFEVGVQRSDGSSHEVLHAQVEAIRGDAAGILRGLNDVPTGQGTHCEFSFGPGVSVPSLFSRYMLAIGSTMTPKSKFSDVSGSSLVLPPRSAAARRSRPAARRRTGCLRCRLRKG
jgi:hypothetical protein